MQYFFPSFREIVEHFDLLGRTSEHLREGADSRTSIELHREAVTYHKCAEILRNTQLDID